MTFIISFLRSRLGLGFMIIICLIGLFSYAYYRGAKSAGESANQVISELKVENEILQTENEQLIESIADLKQNFQKQLENAKKNQKIATNVRSDAYAYWLRRLEEERRSMQDSPANH